MSQGWILDRLLRAGGLDVLWPDVTGTLIEFGFNYADIEKAMAGVQSIAAMPQAWYRTGLRHEQRARQAAEAGHLVTAARTFYRAVGCFGRARWGMLEDGPDKAALYDHLNACYDQVIALGPERIERVEIPLENQPAIPGILHLPAEASEHHPVPGVLLYPGMDMIKEYMPVPHRNVFTARGMAVLSIDHPGHGMSNLLGVKLTERNAEAAGSAAFDVLEQRTDIDADRLGVFGISLGSYFAASLAAEDPRVKAAASFEGGIFYDKIRFVEESQPTFKMRLAYMTGLADDETLHKRLGAMTMEGREHQIRNPFLVVTGEWDELTPLADVNRLYDAIDAPKRAVIYEGENHVLGNVMTEALQDGCDWLVDCLDGRSPPSERVVVTAA